MLGSVQKMLFIQLLRKMMEASLNIDGKTERKMTHSKMFLYKRRRRLHLLSKIIFEKTDKYCLLCCQMH